MSDGRCAYLEENESSASGQVACHAYRNLSVMVREHHTEPMSKLRVHSSLALQAVISICWLHTDTLSGSAAVA